MSELWKMKLRTAIKIQQQQFAINHQDSMLLMGSCFSENIGKKLIDHKFNALINPLGIAYNPISLHHLLSIQPSKLEKVVEGLQKTDELFFHYNFHSEFNAITEQEISNKLQSSIQTKEQFLQQKPTIILSYGTAWVHELKTTAKIVNNCHKQAASIFNKRLLKVEEIVASWVSVKEELEKRFKKPFNFIFTLSPVRHIKDGFTENQESKSTLNLAIHQICSAFKNCSYFPAYEIMMDDLRDYRFYKEDLLHPNDTAVNYIWEQFANAYFSKETQNYNQQINQIQQSINHRAFNPQSEKHQAFIKKLIKEVEKFEKETKIDYSEEIEKLKIRLIN